MKVKLTHAEMQALIALFNRYVRSVSTGNIIDRMVLALLEQVYVRLWAKGPEPTAGSLKMSEAEAIAFWAFWNAIELPLDMVFEQNLIMKLSIKIHQTLQL